MEWYDYSEDSLRLTVEDNVFVFEKANNSECPPESHIRTSRVLMDEFLEFILWFYSRSELNNGSKVFWMTIRKNWAGPSESPVLYATLYEACAFAIAMNCRLPSVDELAYGALQGQVSTETIQPNYNTAARLWIDDDEIAVLLKLSKDLQGAWIPEWIDPAISLWIQSSIFKRYDNNSAVVTKLCMLYELSVRQGVAYAMTADRSHFFMKGDTTYLFPVRPFVTFRLVREAYDS